MLGCSRVLAHGPDRKNPLVRKTSTTLDTSTCSKSFSAVWPSASTSKKTERSGTISSSRVLMMRILRDEARC